MALAKSSWDSAVRCTCASMSPGSRVAFPPGPMVRGVGRHRHVRPASGDAVPASHRCAVDQGALLGVEEVSALRRELLRRARGRPVLHHHARPFITNDTRSTAAMSCSGFARDGDDVGSLPFSSHAGVDSEQLASTIVALCSAARRRESPLHHPGQLAGFSSRARHAASLPKADAHPRRCALRIISGQALPAASAFSTMDGGNFLLQLLPGRARSGRDGARASGPRPAFLHLLQRVGLRNVPCSMDPRRHGRASSPPASAVAVRRGLASPPVRLVDRWRRARPGTAARCRRIGEREDPARRDQLDHAGAVLDLPPAPPICTLPPRRRYPPGCPAAGPCREGTGRVRGPPRLPTARTAVTMRGPRHGARVDRFLQADVDEVPGPRSRTVVESRLHRTAGVLACVLRLLRGPAQDQVQGVAVPAGARSRK